MRSATSPSLGRCRRDSSSRVVVRASDHKLLPEIGLESPVGSLYGLFGSWRLTVTYAEAEVGSIRIL
ncbi:unnamed protein product [Clonostachys rhizophaga]|uniref:Uncharacterized protein n=1 Tax=Clonostachys rhizophaga TaxID=160324 RepID=A0A9N9YBC3_9HYPO|nr:unnamed protein product [Clonostachys rhizophaga]